MIDKTQVVILYLNSAVEKINIFEYIEENSTYFRDKYLAWTYNQVNNINNKKLFILDDQFDFFNTSLFEEKSVWNQKSVITIIQVFAIEKLINEYKPRKIHLINTSNKFNKSVVKICSFYKVDFQLKTKLNLPYIANSIINIFYYLKGLAWVFKTCIKYFIFLFSKPNVSIKNNSVLVFSYFYNISNLSINNFCTEYWGKGDFVKTLNEKNLNVTWGLLDHKNPILDSVFKKRNFLKQRNKNGESIFMFESYITFNILYKTIAYQFAFCIKYLFTKKSEFSSQETNLNQIYSDISKNDLRNSIFGQNATKNIFYYYIFKTFFTEKNTFKLALYLHENISWEKSYLFNWKCFNNKPILGYMHSTIRYWDLRYFNDTRWYKNPRSIKPEQYVLNGKDATKKLKNFIPDEQIFSAEALRYQYLNKKHVFAPNEKDDTLIFLGEYSHDITEFNFNLLISSLLSLNKKYKIFYKPHPANYLATKKKYKKNRFLFLEIVVIEGTMSDFINISNLIVASISTSAALELYLQGYKVILISEINSLNLSPLRDEENVVFVSTAEQLKNAIITENCSYNSININSYFNVSDNLDNWNKIINQYV